MTFNENELKHQIEINNEQEKLLKNKIKLESDIFSNKYALKSLERQLNDINKKLADLKSIKNFLFNHRASSQTKRDLSFKLNTIKNSLEESQKKLADLKNKLNEINQKLEKIESELKYKIPGALTVEDEIISISDENVDKAIYSDYNGFKELVVHCTDFFPKNGKLLCNYDGNKPIKTEIEFNGVSKEIKGISHRHTCHFIINNVVISHAYGNWDQKKFVIIEPLEPHKNQFVSLNNGDAFTYGSLDLQKPILLVREDCYNEIPQNEISNFNIIKYKGRYDNCTLNILRILGIPIKYFDENNPTHYLSVEMQTENILNDRDLCINYLKNNNWDGKSNVILSEKDIFNLYDIVKSSKGNDYFKRAFENLTNLKVEELNILQNTNIDFICYMTIFGIEKVSNGYTFKNDDSIYYIFDKFQDKTNQQLTKDEKITLYSSIYSSVDIQEMQKLYEQYETYKQQSEISNKSNNIPDLSSMSTKSLFEFENIEIAKRVVESLEKSDEIKIHLTQSGCEIVIKDLASKYNNEYLESNGVKYKIDDYANNFLIITQTIAADNVQEMIDKYRYFQNIIINCKTENLDTIKDAQIQQTL